MLQHTKINLFIANHGKKEGVEDYITSFEYMFEQRGFDFSVSEKLQEDAINLVIDEFTNFAANRYIANFSASKRNASLVFVLTEFIENHMLACSSFNHFGGIRNSAILALVNCFLRNARSDFRPAKLVDYLRVFLYFPVLAWLIIPFSLNFMLNLPKGMKKAFKSVYRNYLHRLIYMHGRYLGFEAMVNCADAVMTCHQGIEDGYSKMRERQAEMPPSFGVFYPEFSSDGINSSMLSGKTKGIEMTGSITHYRTREMYRINRQIKLLGLASIMGEVESRAFGKKATKKARATFSIHPPQTARWPYSSPTRIYRSLVVDHNIPILTRHYRQHPIENICLLLGAGSDCLSEMYQMIRDPEVLEQFLSGRVGRYLEIAKIENNQLCDKLRSLRA